MFDYTVSTQAQYIAQYTHLKYTSSVHCTVHKLSTLHSTQAQYTVSTQAQYTAQYTHLKYTSSVHCKYTSSVHCKYTHLKYTFGWPFECFTKTPIKHAPIQIVLPWISWGGWEERREEEGMWKGQRVDKINWIYCFSPALISSKTCRLQLSLLPCKQWHTHF